LSGGVQDAEKVAAGGQKVRHEVLVLGCRTELSGFHSAVVLRDADLPTLEYRSFANLCPAYYF